MKCIKPASPYVMFLGILLTISISGVFLENIQNINSNESNTVIKEIESNHYMASIQLMNNK